MGCHRAEEAEELIRPKGQGGRGQGAGGLGVGDQVGGGQGGEHEPSAGVEARVELVE